MMRADRKAVDNWLKNLEHCMEAGNINAIAEKLSDGLNSFMLTRFRERKSILHAPIGIRESVSEILLAKSTFASQDESKAFSRYLHFSLTIDATRKKTLENLHSILRQISPCSKAALLTITHSIFELHITELFKDFSISLAGKSVAEREHQMHEINGSVNDIAAAIARSVNEYARITTFNATHSFTRKQRHCAESLLREAITLAGNVNSLEWYFDCVTYGDFIVDDYADSQLRTFRFQFADPTRHLLRRLAIRRTLVLNFASPHREQRLLREILKKAERAALHQAVTYYQRKVMSFVDPDFYLDQAKVRSDFLLKLIDAEDDLLLAASINKSEILVYYFVSMGMRWYAAAASAIQNGTRTTNQKTLKSITIPLDKITASIDGAEEQWIATAIDCLTSELPARSHVSLMNRPFVRDGLNSVRPLLNGDLGIWNVSIRETLIHGGVLGKNVGLIWERFYETCFEQTDWKIVGRGVKLKKDGQMLTDVDLLLLREDLLLIVQIKALVGSGNTIYDHWKNRQIIEFGCSQGRIAANYFDSNSDALISICGKRTASLIKCVRPVVLTNCDHLNGWSFEGVPVMSEVTRKAICYGSKVQYFGHNGDVLHTHDFVKHNELTTESILKILQNSIEIEIAAEGNDIEHTIQKVEDLIFLLPEFSIRKNLSELSIHEPKVS